MRIIKTGPKTQLKRLKLRRNSSNYANRCISGLIRALSVFLTALLTTLPFISSSHATDYIIPTSPPIFPTQNISGGDSVTILKGGIIMDAGDGIFSNGFNTSVTVDNAGTITSTGANGIRTFDTLNLFNRTTGVITGASQGVDAYSIGQIINSGIIESTDDAINSFGVINSLINSGTIRSTNGEGVESFFVINNLINSGTIEGGNNGVYVSFFDIQNLENSGTITGGTIGIFAARNIEDLKNSGTITGTNNEGVRAVNNILSLTNTGSIFGKVYGVSAGDGLVADGIVSLTNAGAITGGDIAIYSAGGVDTHLTLNPGSDIYGGLNLGSGTNTLTVGKGLSIDHVFSTLPNVINTNGQPLFIDGTRVVVVATNDLDHQQDIALYDLTQAIWGTVFNNIGDGRNPGNSFINGGTTPQFNLGAISPDETPASYNKSHMWASAFGSHRIDDDTRHNLGGLIIGLDGTINSSLRMGAFFGTSRTEVDFNGTYREMETDTIFGGLYASLNAQGLTIDLGITGGETEHDGTRIVDNNRVNGLQTISSNFDGTFIAPELAIKTRTNLGGVTIQPTLSLGYAGLFLDGYTESGTNAAPLTVGENDIHIIHARFEIAALLRSKGEDSLNFQFSPYLGIKGRSLIDGEATNISMFGTSYNFNNDGDDDIGSAFAGFRLSVLQTETFGIFAGLEGSVDTESSTLLTANAGLKWRF